MKKLGNKIYSLDLGIQWVDNYEEVCDKLIRRHKASLIHYRIRNTYVTIPKKEYCKIFEDHLLKSIKNQFDKIQISDGHSIFTYVSNNQWAKNEWHNHLTSFSSPNKGLSTVFYLKKPDCGDGKISIIDDDNFQIDYLPKQGEYLIFPLHYMHCPTKYENEEHRIAINLNVMTSNTYSEFFF